MTVRRCSNCHNYIEGSPSPDLVHVGKYGADCRSHHHKDPCDYVSKEHGPCNFYKIETGGKTQGEGEDLQVTQLLARDQTRLEEMDKMSKEIVTLKSRESEFDRMSTEMAEMREMIKALRNPSPQGGTLAAPHVPPQIQTLQIPNPQTPLHSSPLTSGHAQQPPLSQQGRAGSLLADVQSHIQKNKVPTENKAAIGVMWKAVRLGISSLHHLQLPFHPSYCRTTPLTSARSSP